jgi:predicted RNA binding protein YcfA (HicA-like mRNA interferase family)
LETSSGSQAAPLPAVKWTFGNWWWREELNGKFYTFYYTLIDGLAYSDYSISMERDSKKIVKRLLSEGFVLVASKGSHPKFAKGGVLIVPHPKKDLPLGTARSIAKMAGWL